jgi:predicted RNase H-like HicB family nuclease
MNDSENSIVYAEEDGFVAIDSALDIASEGVTAEETVTNLNEAVDLFYECTPLEEVQRRENQS